MADAHVLGVAYDSVFDGSASASALKPGISFIFHVSLLTLCDNRRNRVADSAKVVADFLRLRTAAFVLYVTTVSHFPVSELEAATRFDSGEPRKRRKIDRNTNNPVDMNSDCQF